MEEDLCSFHDWDSKHFLYRIGKINKEKLNNNDFINVEDWIGVNNIECIYAVIYFAILYVIGMLSLSSFSTKYELINSCF